MYHSLNVAQDLENIVYTEKERPAGMEHLYGLIHAIKNRLRIRFVYTKFWEDAPRRRSGKPYALKEFRRRWYVLLHDDDDKRIKVFGLDRISELEITGERFLAVDSVDVEALFAPCFGVTIPDDADPQEVTLAFTAFQGKYVKSLPLHHSQKIVSEAKNELRISLNVYLTYELEMQILSYGEDVRVIRPKALINRIRQRLDDTLRRYATKKS
jgi:predicted DNA-binding transcriptional regulator YafY